jgi:hypothetical protein
MTSIQRCKGDCLCIGNNPYEADLSCLMDYAEGLAKPLYEEVGVRYGNWAWENQDRMRQFLPDTDPFLHGIYQAQEIAIPFIECEDFTEREARLLLTANVLHDMHEYLTGDVPKPLKTKESDAEELEVNLEVVRGILGLDREHPFMQDYRSVMGDLEGWSKVGRAFSAIETCGYFNTGMNAWFLRNNPELSAEEQSKCEDMGRIVAQSCIGKMQRSEFLYPRDLLTLHGEELGRM